MELLLRVNISMQRQDSILSFSRIDSIRQLAIDHDDEDLLLEAGLLRMHYFYYNSAWFSPSLIQHLLDSLKNEGIKRKKIWLEASVENMQALYNFQSLKRYDLAFEHHQRVYELIRDISPKEYPDKQNVLNQIATEYYRFNDFRESIFYNQEALKADAETPEAFRYQTLSSGNMIGLCYQQLNMLDSADHYFRGTLDRAIRTNSEDWEGISSGNLGYSLFLRREYDQAIPLLEKDVRIGTKREDWGLVSNSLMVLSDISLARQQTGRAALLLDTARQYAYRSAQYYRLQRLYPLLSKLYAAQNKPALAAVFIDSALFVKDSFIRQLHSLQMLRTKQKMALDQYRAEMDIIKSRKEVNILERNILVGVVLVIMIAIVYLYRAQRKKLRRREQELATASRQLTDFAKNISEKNALIELLHRQKEDDQTAGMLQQLEQSTILTDADWDYFRTLFEKVHSGFLRRLREQFPGLTPAETRFMALARLQLSNKEMAAMLGLSADTIRQYRSRLRKKLNVSEENSLEELIARI